ncbi:MAG TPA: PadR family transcriptional regulator [Anaerolineaceae bacterium]|nr:PadR family transcriptional regulator [Anaerolineaceae bacterium]HPN52779.1 PadR family transcriptional regulator [Anaerolineaceae bacterium]
MTVRNALLGLLAKHPNHGYELHAAFVAMAGGKENWDVKPAQVYTTLARLQEAGLVEISGTEQDGGPEKRIYAITPAGLTELKAWFATPVVDQHQRDEFFLKLMTCLASGEADPYRVIQTQRASLYQQLHQTTTLRGTVDQHAELAYLLLLDQTVMHLEADLRWLDMVEARLDDIRRQPLPQPELKKRGRPRSR